MRGKVRGVTVSARPVQGQARYSLVRTLSDIGQSNHTSCFMMELGLEKMYVKNLGGYEHPEKQVGCPS